MEIKQPKSENDYEKIDNFFGNIWKEEFDLDRFNQIEQYKGCEIFFIEKNSKIISAISCFKKDGKWMIGRFGTLKEFRNKGFGTKIFEKFLDFLEKSGEKEIFLNGEFTKIGFYKKFGFEEIGEPKEIGNTKSILMRKFFLKK